MQVTASVEQEAVATAKTTLAGLYIGIPTWTTAHLTAEHLLEAFQGLMLTIIREGRRRCHISHLLLACTKGPRAPGLLGGHFHVPLRRFSQTSLKMSEP